jgi:prefoldin beta subunit
MTDRKEYLRKIQESEQTMQGLLQQKQAFANQKSEIDDALKELETADTAYHIVANIMIKKDTKELSEGLSEQKELIDLRLKAIEKQEEKVREQIRGYQESVMKG